MSRPYIYYPAWDGKAASPLILKVAELCQKRWKGTKNLGTYVNRDMRGKPGQKSVHATGFALDLAFVDQKQAAEIWNYFIAQSENLMIQELHWYNKPGTKHGVGYRCSRGPGAKGVKVFTDSDNAGPGGNWLHIEVDKAVSPEEWETRFRASKPV